MHDSRYGLKRYCECCGEDIRLRARNAILCKECGQVTWYMSKKIFSYLWKHWRKRSGVMKANKYDWDSIRKKVGE